MTMSLVYYHPDSGLAASLSATGGVAVGGYVNHSWRGLGCCVTQGLVTNPWYPEKVKDLLAGKMSSKEIIAELLSADADHRQRQCMVIDQNGRVDCFSGQSNLPEVAAGRYSHLGVCGNMLSSAAVLTAMATVFWQQVSSNAAAVIAGNELPNYLSGYQQRLPEVLLAVLQGAIAAGGDRRGTFSAALRVESYSRAPIDIRVDWAEKNLAAQMREVLAQVRAPQFSSFLNKIPLAVSG